MAKKRTRKANPNGDLAPTYRVLASTQFEAARARLARAHEAAEGGHTDVALDLATEGAFEAGTSFSFALLAGEAHFAQRTDEFLDETQAFVRLIAPMTTHEPQTRPQLRVANPMDARNALAMAKREQGLVLPVFFAGLAHGHAQVEQDAALKKRATRFLQARKQQAQSRARAPNPNLSTRKLKAKLLR